VLSQLGSFQNKLHFSKKIGHYRTDQLKKYRKYRRTTEPVYNGYSENHPPVASTQIFMAKEMMQKCVRQNGLSENITVLNLQSFKIKYG
jgi:hypothetical protein